MSRSAYSGKRGANAGDEFHELWALRRALATLSARSSVQYVTVEGIAAPAGIDPDAPEWDGVDCAIYHGPERDTVDQIEVVQAKYSPSAPTKEWTLARFIHSAPGKKRNASVAARLAEAFAGMCRDHPDLAEAGRIAVKLVSNQPASSALAGLTSPTPPRADKAAIAKATGLAGSMLDDFLAALDFSECGSIGRKGIEEQVIKDIAAWDDVDTAGLVYQFREFIRNRMRPEGNRMTIDAESILSIFHSGNLRTIFPCPPDFELVEGLIPRQTSDDIMSAFASGKARICLHGQGGEGKTTILADIAARLPEHSLVVAFDCYGGGSYLNSNSYRHKAPDAFVQLANDCSTALLLPLLLTQNRDSDHPRLFMDRLERTAAELANLHPDALLVVAIDAADNSVAAAEDAADGVPSFVSAFLKLGDPPPNVRFLVSARTGRLDKIALPSAFEKKVIGPFTQDEIARFLEPRLGVQTEAWYARVLKLTGGNPRVLKYALGAADGDPAQFIDYLAPHGKNLSGIFAGIVADAFTKAGSEADVRGLCAALTLLPRPIPICALAAVAGHSEDHVRDILADLRPGIILDGERAGFRDEDFEHFVRETGGDASAAMLERAADYFIAGSASDAYAAEHASNILVRAGRHAALIGLAREDVNAYPVADPAVRTAIHEARMRAALRVCRASGDSEAAIKLLLAGADAFRRDAAIRSLLFDNVDLSAHFSREQMRTIFLADPDQRQHHGKFLMHAIAAGAGRDDPARIAHEQRLLFAWFASHSDRQRAEEVAGETWELEAADIAAFAVGRIESEGAAAALRTILNGRPGHFRTAILRAAIDRLARSGDLDAIAELAALLPRRYPWIGLAEVFPALAGRPFDIGRLVGALEQARPKIAKWLGSMREVYGSAGERLDLLELFIGGTEVALMHGAPKAKIRPLLKALAAPELLSPQRMSGYANPANNIALRAAVLLRVLDGKPARAEDVIARPVIKGRSRDAQRKRRARADEFEKAKKAISAIVGAYKLRSEALLGTIAPRQVANEIAKVAAALRTPTYGYDDYHEQRGRHAYFARALVPLAAQPGVKAAELFEVAIKIKGSGFPASDESSELLRAAQYVPALATLVPQKIEAIAAEVRHRKIAGNDKIELITRYARIALYQSAPVASAAFNLAVDVASEIDAESVQALSVCKALARRGRSVLGDTEATHIARALAAIAKDVGERIGSQDNYPWGDIMAALVRLDLPLALAAAARFEETGLENIVVLLDPLLVEAIEAGVMSPAAATALAALAGAPLDRLVRALGANGLDAYPEAAEYLAQDLVWRRAGSAQSLLEKLGAAALHRGPWMRALHAAAAFSETLPKPDRMPSYRRSEPRPEAEDILFDWSAIRSADDLVAAVEAAAATVPKEQYLLPSDLVNRAVDQVPSHRRVDALTYATARRDRFGYTYHIGDFLAKRLEDWADDPAVAQWRETQLAAAITADLDNIVRYIEMGQSKLRRLLALTGASDAALVDCLLAGVEARIDELGAGQIYLLAGEIARHAPAAAAAAALEEHVARRLQRLVPADRALAAMDDVPLDAAEAIARFIFAMAGRRRPPNMWELGTPASSHTQPYAERPLLGATKSLLNVLERAQSCRRRKGAASADAKMLWASPIVEASEG